MNGAVKKLITVIAEFTTYGDVRPKALIWEDGRRFDVDQIIDIRKCASLKSGGRGLRYTCRIRDKTLFLFREDDIWFWENIV